MPNLKHRDPSYRLHKASGQGIVTLGGVDHYLGAHGTEASRREYDRLLSEWKARGKRLACDDALSATVAELANAHRKHAEIYYRKNGKRTSEVTAFKTAMRHVLALYADLPTRDFHPKCLMAVRQRMIEAGWVRTSVNRQVTRVRMVFYWGVLQDLVPPEVAAALKAVKGMQPGRHEGVEEAEPVRPAPDAHIDAVEPHVSRQVWAMVQVQRYTGMRPGEVTTMRGCDLDTTGKLWEYKPESHKTEHRGRQRLVPIGPRARKYIEPFLKSDTQAYLFSPVDATRERYAAAKTHRRPNQKPNTRKSKRKIREFYDAASYRRAIERACKLAGVPVWNPHQLRHTFATAVRKQYGLEIARATLGHASAATSEIYAEVDFAKAAEVAARIG